jgi:hypothetical protein
MPQAPILLKIAAIPERVPLARLNLRSFADDSELGQKPHPLSIGKWSRYPRLTGLSRVRKNDARALVLATATPEL